MVCTIDVIAFHRDEIMTNGKLDPILKEKIAIKVSTVNKCNPCYVIKRSLKWLVILRMRKVKRKE